MPVVETGVPEEPLAKPQAVDAAHRIEEQNERDERQNPEEAAEEANDAPVSKPLRFYLSVSDPIVDAPSIGNKTAKRFNKIGAKTVSDLLALDPTSAAARINARHITPDVLGQWQAQATLACRIPQIRGHDAQILVACGYDHVDAVADADVNRLLAETEAFAATSQGERIIRSGKAPDHAEVSDWINWAQQARPLKAA